MVDVLTGELMFLYPNAPMVDNFTLAGITSLLFRFLLLFCSPFLFPLVADHECEYNILFSLGTGAWEYFEPEFVFHGFQYIQITGYPGVPAAESIQAYFIHSGMSLNLLEICVCVCVCVCVYVYVYLLCLCLCLFFLLLDFCSSI